MLLSRVALSVKANETGARWMDAKGTLHPASDRERVEQSDGKIEERLDGLVLVGLFFLFLPWFEPNSMQHRRHHNWDSGLVL